LLVRRWDFDATSRWVLLIIMLVSPAWLILSAISGEDKLIYAALPLLLCWLVPRHLVAAVLIGAVYAGVSGFGLFYMPLLAIACWKAWPNDWPRLALLAVASAVLIALTWLPYWPENHAMMANRVARESVPPFWYSIWTLAPALFSPMLSKGIAVLFALAGWWGYATRRVTLLGAMIAIAFAFFVSANFINHYRVVAMLFLPLLALRRDSTGWWLYALLAFIQLNFVLAMRALHIEFPSTDLPWDLRLLHVTLTNMCLVCYLALFVAELAGHPRETTGDSVDFSPRLGSEPAV
jgi:hypothetical protein